MNIKDMTLDDMIWMSYRYCIGRHTIAASHHAGDLAQLFKDNKFKEQRLLFYAKDIMECINNTLRFYSDVIPNILEKDLLSKLMPYYKDEGNFIYEVSGDDVIKTKSDKEITYSWKSSLTDLMPWYKLAKGLNPDLEITVEYEGETTTYKGFQYYGYNGEKHFTTVDNYFDNPYIDSFISPEYIVKINYVK